MDFQVVFTDEALTDLQRIVEGVADDNPEAAEKLGLARVDHAQMWGIFLSSVRLEWAFRTCGNCFTLPTKSTIECSGARRVFPSFIFGMVREMKQSFEASRGGLRI